MPPHLESDDVDDIKTGTYVYWMKANEDCRWHPRGPDGSYRGHVGHVTAVTAVTAVMEVTAVSICPSLSTSHRCQDVAERGELGEVVRVDDNGRRKVSFPKVGPWFDHVRIMFHIVSLAWMNLG